VRLCLHRQYLSRIGSSFTSSSHRAAARVSSAASALATSMSTRSEIAGTQRGGPPSAWLPAGTEASAGAAPSTPAGALFGAGRGALSRSHV